MAMKDQENRDPGARLATPRRATLRSEEPRPAKAESPQEIRDLLCQDTASVSDTQLLALVLATGSRAPGKGREKGGWTSLELAARLIEEAGGRLGDLVQAAVAQAVDWRSYSIGKNIGGRLVAAMELAERWRVGTGAEGGTSGAPLLATELSSAVFERRRLPTQIDLVALLLGFKLPEIELAERLLAGFGSLRELVGTLSFDAFEPAYRRSQVYLRLTGTDVKVERSALCRLVAAVELARRYGGRESLGPASLGLASENLERLLDPATPLDPELRRSLIDQLRSHPELAADFARLDRLTGDAGTSDYQRAAEVHRMFQALSQRQGWTHPEEIVGVPVPYRALLSIARAAIERTSEPAPRMLEVRDLLAAAERRAAARPVAAFVDALRGLRLSESGADWAIEEARDGYLAGGPGTRACSTLSDSAEEGAS